MQDIQHIDEVHINFGAEGMVVVNILLGIIMFGVALGIKKTHFTDLLKNPKSPLICFISQFFLLPLFTFLLVLTMRPEPSVALGLMLVAACPGGNISNFMSSLSRSNAALSVSMTAIATLLAVLMTPLNFSFYAGLYPDTKVLLQDIHISFFKVFEIVLILLGIPLVLGMTFAHHFPKMTKKIVGPIQKFSILIFLAFVVGAFSKNYDIFLNWIHIVFFIVVLHNLSGYVLGYFFSKIFRCPKKDCRTISIETGIQNAGLGLVLIFNFFDGLGGMAIAVAWWAIWDILSGLALAYYWSRKSVKP